MTTHRIRRLRHKFPLTLFPLLLAACSRAPSVDVLGSFFPSWLVCLALGLLLTVAARFAAMRLHVKVVYPVLVYLSMVAIFTFAFWLIIFD